MKIVQSLWTLPMLNGRGEIYENRFHGGWLNVKYHLLSLAYSSLQLSKYYRKLSLVTDKAGNDMLINKMGLPYTEVTICLDELNDYDTQLWSLGKIHAYSIQDEPFIHVDGDAFIWEPFPKKFLTADLVAQNLEHNYEYYRTLMEELVSRNCYIPAVVSRITALENEVNAYNAGVYGGSNIAFFKAFAKEVDLFLKNNLPNMPQLQVGKLNAFFEQHLFYCMAREWGLKVACVTDIIDKEVLDFMLKDISQFLQAPEKVKYIHLLGGEAKTDPAICNRLETLMKETYPEYYRRILSICESDFAGSRTPAPVNSVI